MDRATVAHDVFVRDHALLERSIDIVEIDVGGEAIDPGIDAGWLLPMHIALRRKEIGQYPQIRKPSRVGGVGRVAANALEIIALEIELLRFS
jgi:hypothetical protein